MKYPSLCFPLLLIAFLITSATHADTAREIACEIFEQEGSEAVTASIKYRNAGAKHAIWTAAENAVHLEFISRIVVEAAGNDLWSLCERDDVGHIELIGDLERDSVLHRILELWRVNHYVVGGRFDVSVFNFSQGVRDGVRGRSISAEVTISEALDSISRRISPVFVAAGNSGTTDVNPYANGRSVFPVVATTAGNKAVYSGSSRPDQRTPEDSLFLFSEGAPRREALSDIEHPACASGEHLTIGQMLRPEQAGIDPGGSSFATFAATSAICPIHQYLQVLNAYLSASKEVGEVQLDPFIAYYVDNPISATCPALDKRLADKPEKYAPIYDLEAQQKARIQDMLFGNSMLFNFRYSPQILRAFLKSLPDSDFLPEFEGKQVLLNKEVVFQVLSTMTFADWLDIGANKQSLYFSRWKRLARADTEPLLPQATLERIAGYCDTAGLFLVLSDQVTSPF